MKTIYAFGEGKAEGDKSMKDLLGGKGAGLAEMCRLGLPVPPGFTITTEICNYYYAHQRQYPKELESQAAKSLSHIEKIMGEKFGDPEKPLLVSVRSGSRASMPGMMDTILNLGLNKKTLKGLTEQSKNIKFAQDSFERLKHMFQDVVGKPLPENPQEQLWEAIAAVFESWNSKRAIEYRRINRIPQDWGTACNVQAMVFGNMGDDSASGVAFTRDPSTGEKRFFGEYLRNAQGEDLVAGVRTPEPLEQLQKTLPHCYQELLTFYQKLERHYRDMQDMEFTIQKGKVWMLQTRRGQRTAKAAVKIAVDMVSEGLINKEEALLRIEPNQIDQLLHPMISPRTARKVLTKGLPASPGAAVGRVVFTAEEAVQWSEKKEAVILVRSETSAEDIHGMHVAQGILTSRGGMTSHAAVVARGMGKVCVVGCGAMEVDVEKKEFSVNGKVVKEGDWLTIDGTTGDVMLGKLPTMEPELSKEYQTLMSWADAVRKLKIRANADTPEDARRSLNFGAEGIGLCRTEHMFFDEDRIQAMRQMIVAESTEERKKALAKLKPMQKNDFLGIFRVMKGLPVTIRLLDPPLHEFLPQTQKEIQTLSKEIDVPVERLKKAVDDLKEMNPMLGHRGCRLGVTYPEIYEMQIEAIMEAVCELKRNEKIEVFPEIELPLISLKGEIQLLRKLCEDVCEKVMKETGERIAYRIGTMVETPRAAFRSDAIAPHADFFSFGTNDLTQTTLGISRDDGFKFLPEYEQKGLVRCDPFQTIDFEGVGELMKVCVEKARKVKPKMEIGICGEHGGDPESIVFCHQIGLNYVSCSPFRVPIARLAAARAVLLERL
ncbi:MAG: pyruvate, phosphate dikinase [Deltaproteobacteria bacterium RIFCSPLOWO2_12_FULL_44_12]|nr:MAG: pyruvate, phosphate dikinase [Deltaproteobacteria bacterium RIFCSPHIGHO2_01_FULL_43_49]OGQ14506.1 MAG: pyruvate, phosphate dikinase [Deltaproteobacteria bacterium RIFCSPHIGHO2_02_FULL_44_53]OGQ27892.1 MAG: pyruvate, phosphate dikinase [Deltaproteobacteria bacterium RIFCSPHIGHO2_12_FULL_44_21]OGQ31104.1 MAG: pyruvate, phosphate dikinase [Deltaproteobacteria bacterium RIFCSPLOWO2_01_FULL_45_74]OGQ43095.1 MAG: pyruvate, phosphate dikinase [Deltaproteobacteria bacterium RIFCSPLOWO2_02_FULL_